MYLTLSLLAMLGSPTQDLPPYFVAIIQERTLFARDESILIRVRLGNQNDRVMKTKKFPDLIAGLRVTQDGQALALAVDADSRALFQRSPHLEINAHRDFRIKLDRYFPDIRKGGTFSISYQDAFADINGLDIRIEDFDLPDLETPYIVHTSMGSFTLKLNPLDAPNHACNFAILVASGFYKDMTVHRVIRRRIIQTGDPNGNGSGGSGFSVALETSPFLKHEAYAVGMARAQDPNSAQSQFYVCLVDMPELDQLYTVFAKVVDGHNVLQEMGSVGTTGADGDPPDRPFDEIKLLGIEAAATKP